MLNATPSFSYAKAYEYARLTCLRKEVSAKFYGRTECICTTTDAPREAERVVVKCRRYTGQFGGIVVGVAALRMSFQQSFHLYSSLVELTQEYASPSC